jgi:DNA-binding NarL/FixJ family response regulator
VVIAAESLLLGDGLAALLSAEADVTVLGRARRVHEIRAMVEEHEPDVLVVSVLTPLVTTLETILVARELRETHPGLGVVVVSDRGDGFALELLRGGSERIAYLLDESLPDISTVVSALRQVTQGQTVLSPTIADSLVRRSDGIPIDDLSSRELDVLEQLAFGASNRSIAATLHLSVKAVEKHVSAIFRKLDLTDRGQVDRRVSAAVVYLRSISQPFG